MTVYKHRVTYTQYRKQYSLYCVATTLIYITYDYKLVNIRTTPEMLSLLMKQIQWLIIFQ